MIRVTNVIKYFDDYKVLDEICLHVRKGTIYGLVGPNGAGKTTTMQSVIGLIPSQSGLVMYDGHDISKMPCHKIVHLGMSQVPEGRRVFQELTVYENLVMGAYSIKDNTTFKDDIDRIYTRFPRLAERKNQIAGTLSGGEQQMLAMGRALLADPELIVLDEPSMGLSPLLVSEIFEIVKSFKEAGKTVLLVEQNAKKAMSISDRVYVLETGSITMSGNAKELINDPNIKKAYLGE